MIVGLAGHIDHGKSALVEALTGQPMDRLEEERARGITIDLNFAPLRLPSGEVLGIVDVPGHEAFVRTMVAGAAGIDVVLLVIAADEGAMPQTREHLAIVEALGVSRGIPVLTKCDLVEPDWIALVREEVDEWLAGSPVAFVPSLAVSARTGAGIDALRGVITDVAAKVPARDATAPFRMPVDRAFSMAGAGTVVTGSIWSGTVAAGEQLRLLPSSTPVRVRTLEAHGERVERAGSGGRAAVALANIEKKDVRRGDVLVDSTLPWEATLALDVQIQLLPTAPRPLTSRSRVHLHLGTAEVIARVQPATAIPPGASGLARLSCERPLVAGGGDRFVLRSYSPVSTIGGGVVLDPLPPSRRGRWPPQLAAPEPVARLLALLARHPPVMPAAALALRAGLAQLDVERELTGTGAARRLAAGWVLTAQVEAARDKALSMARAYHAEHPSRPGIPTETLRRGIHGAAAVAFAALDELTASGALQLEGSSVRVPGFEVRIAGGNEGVQRVLAAVRAAGLTAPVVQDLTRQFEGVDVAGALRVGVEDGQVEAVTRDWYLSGEALAGFADALSGAGAEGIITLSALRDRTGLSRKYLIPLLEWADRKGITRREGEGRRLT